MTQRITATDERAAEIVQMYESKGKIVRKVIIEGRKIEVEFQPEEDRIEGGDFIKW